MQNKDSRGVGASIHEQRLDVGMWRKECLVLKCMSSGGCGRCSLFRTKTRYGVDKSSLPFDILL